MNLQLSHICCALLAFLQITATSGPVQVEQVSADQPAPRTDQNSMIAHEQFLARARHGHIKIYFLGDSITRRWGTSDEQYKHFLLNWKQRSEEHTSELQSRENLVCRLLLEKKKKKAKSERRQKQKKYKRRAQA